MHTKIKKKAVAIERVDAFAVNIDERGVVISGQNANCNCTCGGESTGCAPFNTTCDPAGATYVLASTNGSAWARRGLRVGSPSALTCLFRTG